MNSEKTIKNPTFTLKVGTNNKHNPLVIYLSGRTYVSPLVHKSDYSDNIYDVKHSLCKKISSFLKKNYFFEDKYIFNIKIAVVRMAVGKKSALSFQLYLKQRSDNVRDFKNICEIASNELMTIVDSLYVLLVDNELYPTKTKKTALN